MMEKDRAFRLAGESNHRRWLASRRIWSVEELETLPAGAKPSTSHDQSPGGERCRKRKHSAIFFERTKKSHRQSEEHWNCFKDNVGQTSETRSETAYRMDFTERIDTIFN